MREIKCIAKLLKNRRSERGGAMVEMALIVPVFMVIVTAIGSFGVALNQYLELTNAVTVGAQELGVSRGNLTKPCTNAIDAVYNAAPFLTDANYTFIITFTTSAGVSTQYANSAVGGSAQSQCDTVATAADPTIFTQGESVELSATYSPVSIQWYGSSLSNMKLSTAVTEIVQ